MAAERRRAKAMDRRALRQLDSAGSFSTGADSIINNYDFLMVSLLSFLWFSYGFPMVSLWFSYGFPMVFSMVFLWLPYGFSYGYSMGFHGSQAEPFFMKGQSTFFYSTTNR